MNIKNLTPPGAAEPNPGEEWVATIIALQKRIPALGSVASINRMILAKDGLPHRRLGRRLLFNVPQVCEWLNSQPGMNLPQAG